MAGNGYASRVWKGEITFFSKANIFPNDIGFFFNT